LPATGNNELIASGLLAGSSDQPKAGFSPELPQSGQSTSRTVLSNPPSTSGGSSGASSAGGDTHAVPAGGPGITERLPSSTPRTATQAEPATPPSKLPQKSGRIEQQEPFYGFPSRCGLLLDQFSRIRPTLRSTRHLDAQRRPTADVVPWDVDLSKQLAFDLALALSLARVLSCLLLTQDQSSLRSYF